MAITRVRRQKIAELLSADRAKHPRVEDEDLSSVAKRVKIPLKQLREYVLLVARDYLILRLGGRRGSLKGM